MGEQDELRLSTSLLRRFAWLILGHVSLVLALIGIVLPLLPTTPLLLLAAFSYARGSERFYHWLMNNRYLGPYIRSWRDKGTIPRRTKYGVIALLILVMGTTIVFFIPVVAVQVLLAITGSCIVIYIARIPSEEAE